MAEFDEFAGLDDDVLLGLDIDSLANHVVKKDITKITPISPALSSKSYRSTPKVPVRTVVRTRKNTSQKKMALHQGIKRQERLELPCHFFAHLLTKRTPLTHPVP